MEHNRQYQDNRYQRNNQRNPYDRGPPSRGGRGHQHRDRPYQNHNNRPYGSRNPQFDRNRPYAHQNSNPYGRRGNFHANNHCNWQERTFDARGREVSQSTRSERQDYYRKDEVEVQVIPQLTPLEEKAKSFFHTVLSQEGVRSKLIFMETVENSLQTLQGTADYHQIQLLVDQNASGEFVLKIGTEEIAKGTFPTKQIAKSSLAEQAMDILKKDCFYIVKKKVYEEVSTKEKESKEEAKPQSSFEGSKAHQMMLKMGWGGKGLGVNEQGVEKTVAETIDQNVSRQGLGTDDVFKNIHRLLEDYSKSDKMSLLRFDPDFSSEERAHIHKIAQKFGLKSKSEGKGEERRITITKKLHRGDLVYNLLTCGLENSLYKLIIPEKFEHLWHKKEQAGDSDEEDDCPPHFTS